MVPERCKAREKLYTGRYPMGARGPLSNALRDRVLIRYRRGELATLEEGALIAGVTRRRVLAWLHEAGIDWRAARLHFIARARTRDIEASEGKRARRRPTKTEMHRACDDAKAEWDKRQMSMPKPRAKSIASRVNLD